MRLLLDTHVFLWYISGDPKLPTFASAAIRDKSNEVFLSVVSVWELLVKAQLGKLLVPEPADAYIESRRLAHKIGDLALESSAVARLLTFAPTPQRPF